MSDSPNFSGQPLEEIRPLSRFRCIDVFEHWMTCEERCEKRTNIIVDDIMMIKGTYLGIFTVGLLLDLRTSNKVQNDATLNFQICYISNSI